MIRLARHIEILLLGNDCVIVPNLGGFVVHHVCACYDEGDGLFLPPQRTLGFNPVLKMNDSLLAQSYVEAYDLSYPEAVSTVEDEVSEMVDILHNSGSFELNGLGRLYYDKEGRMNFEPCESGILTPEFYALSSFDMKLLPATNANSGVYGANTNAEVEEPKTSIVYIGNESGRKTLNISLKAIRNVAAAAAILAAGVLISFPIFNNKSLTGTGNIESGFYEMFIPHHKAATEAAPFNTTSTKQEAKKPAPIKVQPVKAEAPEKTATTAAKSYWSIVVCSHVSKANADIVTDKLHKKGFADAYTSETGATKVLLGKFETKEDAHKRLNELVDNATFKDAWLLEVKE